MPTPRDLLFARTAVDYGLLTSQDELRCWEELRRAGENGGAEDFPAVVARLGLLTPYQAAAVEGWMRGNAQQAGREVTASKDAEASPTPTSAREGPPSGAPVRVDAGTIAEADAVGPRGSPPSVNAEPRARFGRYEVLGELGRGGMGVVYRAFDTQLRRAVALKVMLGHAGESDEGRKRFQREALVCARLHHPGIVPVYDVGEIEGSSYFTMELIEGESLHVVLRRMKRLPPRTALKIARDAALALHCAHEHQLVHRDIKPGNLLITRADAETSTGDSGSYAPLETAAGPLASFRVLVSDFGLAKDVAGASRLTETGAVLGTPVYMSPEQADGNVAGMGPASDVYSLGAVLYELLAGRPPFDESNPVRLLAAVLTREPPSLRGLVPELDQDVETMVHKALEKDPSRRYASAREMAEDIARHLQGEPILARRPSLPERMVRALRRHRASAVAGAALLVAVVALSAWFLRAPALDPRVVEWVRQAREETEKMTSLGLAPDATPEEEEQAVARFRGRLRAALAKVDDALKRDPEYAFGLRTRAELLLRMGRYAEAAQAAEKAVGVAPADEPTVYLRGRIHQEWKGTSPHVLDVLVKTKVTIPESSSWSSLIQARMAIFEGKADQAMAALAPLSEAQPDVSECYRVRAMADAASGSDSAKQAAIHYLRQAVANGNAGYGDYLALGQWAWQVGDSRIAAEDLLMAVAYCEKPEKAVLELGRLHVASGNLGIAARWIDQAIALDPEAAMPLLTRAELRLRSADFTGAEADCLRAQSIAPTDDYAVTVLLRVYAQWKSGPDACAYYRASLARGSLDPSRCLASNAAAFAILIETLLDLKLVSEAKEWLAIGIRDRGTHSDFHSLQGQLLYHEENYDAAILSFQRSLELRPMQYKLHVWLSRCHGQKKDHRAAIAELGKAIKLDTGNRDLYLRRAFRLFQLGRMPDGLRDVERVVMLSSVEEVEKIREDLLTGVGLIGNDRVDPNIQKLAPLFLPTLSENLAARADQSLASGQLDQAKLAWERARAVDPNRWRPYLGLAVVSIRRQDWDVAVYRTLDAIDRGMHDFSRLDDDPEFAPLRERREWKRVLDRRAAIGK